MCPGIGTGRTWENTWPFGFALPHYASGLNPSAWWEWAPHSLSQCMVVGCLLASKPAGSSGSHCSSGVPRGRVGRLLGEGGCAGWRQMWQDVSWRIFPLRFSVLDSGPYCSHDCGVRTFPVYHPPCIPSFDCYLWSNSKGGLYSGGTGAPLFKPLSLPKCTHAMGLHLAPGGPKAAPQPSVPWALGSFSLSSPLTPLDQVGSGLSDLSHVLVPPRHSLCQLHLPWTPTLTSPPQGPLYQPTLSLSLWFPSSLSPESTPDTSALITVQQSLLAAPC